MALIDNIRLRDTFQFVFLHICVRLSLAPTHFPSVLYAFTLLTLFIHPSFPLHTLNFSTDSNFLFIIIIPDLTDIPFHPTVSPILTYLSPTLLLKQTEPWHWLFTNDTQEYFIENLF